jgi:hypothetical protein
VTGLDGNGEHTGWTGSIEALAPLTELTYRCLGHTKVHGDLTALAPLTKLTYLDLAETKVVGQAAALAPLVELMHLDLVRTAVSVAGCSAFCEAGGFLISPSSIINVRWSSTQIQAMQDAKKCYCRPHLDRHCGINFCGDF